MPTFPYSESLITDSENDSPSVMAGIVTGINPYSVGNGSAVLSRQIYN